MHIFDQTLIKGQARQQSQIGFGHAESQIGFVGLAPFSKQLVLVKKNPRDGPAPMNRAIQVVVGWRI